MREIQKTAEPHSLTQHRASSTGDYLADYDGYASMGDLRESLSSEQGGICCYCMQRIRPERDLMKVEHWHCQSRYEAEQLDYGNMLGACLGGEGQPGKMQHCDTKKGDSDLSRNPANPAHQIDSFVTFLGDGTIESSNKQFNDELNSILNLNKARIKENRKSVLDSFIKNLPKKSGSYTKIELQNLIAEWNGDKGGDRREYCHVVVYYLRKKLRSLK